MRSSHNATLDAQAAVDLLLVGGGHAHIGVLRHLAMNPAPGLRVRLITPSLLLPYSGMLPASIAGHYRADEMHVDLRRLARPQRPGGGPSRLRTRESRVAVDLA